MTDCTVYPRGPTLPVVLLYRPERAFRLRLLGSPSRSCRGRALAHLGSVRTTSVRGTYDAKGHPLALYLSCRAPALSLRGSSSPAPPPPCVDTPVQEPCQTRKSLWPLAGVSNLTQLSGRFAIAWCAFCTLVAHVAPACRCGARGCGMWVRTRSVWVRFPPPGSHSDRAICYSGTPCSLCHD